MKIIESSCRGPYPPLINVDVSGEPKPRRTFTEEKIKVQTKTTPPQAPSTVPTEDVSSERPSPPPVSRRSLALKAKGQKRSRAEPDPLPEQDSRESLKIKLKLKEKTTRGAVYAAEDLTEQVQASSPHPTEEPSCKRPCRPATEADSCPVEPGSLVLKLRLQKKRSRRPMYEVVTEQVQPSDSAPAFLRALGLAPKRPLDLVTS